MKEKPNIILFITHDQGQFIGCYDSKQTPNSLKTPNLDNVARDGIKFNNYFCTAPQCSPSRGSIQTSLYPHQNGLMGLVDRGWTLPETNKTLPMYLKENGYTTHLLGLQHESMDAQTLGYDTMSKRGHVINYSCNRMKRKYRDFLSEHKNIKKPFYACIGSWEVHRPFGGWGDPVDPVNVKVPPYLPDNDMIHEDFADYYGAIHIVDETIGRLMEHLESFGLAENTLFIFTTDHGEPFPRAKCTLYDPGIKTSLLMSFPNSDLFSNGKEISQMISNIDLLPTILDYIGAKIPKNIEGESFLKCLRNQAEPFRKEIYTEKTFHEFYDPMRSIRTEKYKYIVNFEKFPALYQIDLFTAPFKTGKYMTELIKKPRPDEELYHLISDPTEMNNLCSNSEYKSIKETLKVKLFRWLKETNDPILQGKIKDLRTDPPKIF